MFEANIVKVAIEKILGELNVVKNEENNSYVINYSPKIYFVFPAPQQNKEIPIEKLNAIIKTSGDKVSKNPSLYGIDIKRLAKLAEEQQKNYIASAVVGASGLAVSEYVNLEMTPPTTPPPAGDSIPLT